MFYFRTHIFLLNCLHVMSFIKNFLTSYWTNCKKQNRQQQTVPQKKNDLAFFILSIIYHAVAKNPSSVPPSWIYRLQKALSPLKESPFLQGNHTKSCYPEPHLFFYENFANQLSYYHIRLLTTVSQYVKKWQLLFFTIILLSYIYHTFYMTIHLYSW